MLERGLLPDFSPRALSELDGLNGPATAADDSVRDLRLQDGVAQQLKASDGECARSWIRQRRMLLLISQRRKGGDKNMRKVFIVAVIVVVALALSLPAFAVPSGKTVVLEPKGAGKVVFDGKMHADKGFKCADCHPGVFKMKKDGDKITMKDIREGKFCGTCHNGTKAFNAKDAVSCTKCHKN